MVQAAIRIVCVGGGASAVALVASLLAELRRDGSRTVDLTIVESRDSVGTGLAYGTDVLPLHLMNMEAEDLSITADDPADFVLWLKGFNGDVASPERMRAAVPRQIYGTYLQQRFAEYSAAGRQVGLVVKTVHGRAVGLERSSDGYAVLLATGQRLIGTHLVLSTGHWVQPVGAVDRKSGRSAVLPWPAEELVAASNDANEIAVIGTSLTAIDAILTVAANRGRFDAVQYAPLRPFRIHAASRGGRLPAVRTPLLRLAIENNPALSQPIDVSAHADSPWDLVQRLRAMLDSGVCWALQVCGADPAPGELLGLRPSVSSSQVFAIMRAQLRLMGAAHIGYRARQSVLRAFFKVVSSVYSTVDDAGQRAIVQDFMPEYLVDAAPIPLQTAKQLCALAEAGILTVSSGFAGLLCTADGRPVVDVMGDGLERKQIQVDQVVNAIGRSRSNPAAEQPILRAAINAGVASVHPLGGLRVDTATGLLKDRRGAPVPNAAALGPLLTGSYLGASSVYASTKFSRLLCHAWLGGDA